MRRREILEWSRFMETSILSLFVGDGGIPPLGGLSCFHQSQRVVCDHVQNSPAGSLDQFIVYSDGVDHAVY